MWIVSTYITLGAFITIQTPFNQFKYKELQWRMFQAHTLVLGVSSWQKSSRHVLNMEEENKVVFDVSITLVHAEWKTCVVKDS